MRYQILDSMECSYYKILVNIQYLNRKNSKNVAVICQSPGEPDMILLDRDRFEALLFMFVGLEASGVDTEKYLIDFMDSGISPKGAKLVRGGFESLKRKCWARIGELKAERERIARHSEQQI